MDHLQYKKLRKTLGTQQDVAELLGVTRKTVQERELKKVKIKTEAGLAIQMLSQDRVKPQRLSITDGKVITDIKKNME